MRAKELKKIVFQLVDRRKGVIRKIRKRKKKMQEIG
jgi:hypothetical protein